MTGNSQFALRWVTVVATLLVSSSIFYSGVIKHGGAKDIDARYFFAAAKCWASGVSPYEPETFRRVYQSQFAEAPNAAFVAYLPTLMAVVLPMAPFNWPVAAKIFSLMNFVAAMVLFWACYRLLRELLGCQLALRHWLWVVVAASMGAVAGTIFTGQTSVFVSAACALALLGCRLHRPWMIVIGIVIASAKPHLSGPLLIYIALTERNSRVPIIIGVAGCLLFCGYAAIVDSNVVNNYLSSIAEYGALSVNDPAAQVGLAPILLGIGLSPTSVSIIGAASLAIVMGLAAWALWKSKQSLSSNLRVAMLLLFSVGLAHSIQGYDLCIFATGIALLAAVDLSMSFALLIPALALWRPEQIARLHPAIPANLIASVAALALLVASIVLVFRQLPGRGSKTS